VCAHAAPQRVQGSMHMQTRAAMGTSETYMNIVSMGASPTATPQAACCKLTWHPAGLEGPKGVTGGAARSHGGWHRAPPGARGSTSQWWRRALAAGRIGAVQRCPGGTAPRLPALLVLFGTTQLALRSAPHDAHVGHCCCWLHPAAGTY
jgi:hypothetical protein